jgi:hypothetical protein
MPKTEEDFISEFYGIVINGLPKAIHYNGTRHFVGKKEIAKYKPIFHSLESVLQNIKPKIKQEQEKHGGLLPLALLIPLITGSIAAAGGVTGGIATAVAKSKENQEQIRHNAEMERLAKKGSGIGEDGEDSEVEEIKYCINTLRGFGFEFI